MSLLLKTLIAFTCAVVVGFLMPAPAIADPSEDPCQLAVSFFCKFIPVAPVDGDVDLTKQLPPVDPSVAPPDSRPPNDICLTGCD